MLSHVVDCAEEATEILQQVDFSVPQKNTKQLVMTAVILHMVCSHLVVSCFALLQFVVMFCLNICLVLLVKILSVNKIVLFM